jgi:hypothetical protein
LNFGKSSSPSSKGSTGTKTAKSSSLTKPTKSKILQQLDLLDRESFICLGVLGYSSSVCYN